MSVPFLATNRDGDQEGLAGCFIVQGVGMCVLVRMRVCVCVRLCVCMFVFMRFVREYLFVMCAVCSVQRAMCVCKYSPFVRACVRVCVRVHVCVRRGCGRAGGRVCICGCVCVCVCVCDCVWVFCVCFCESVKQLRWFTPSLTRRDPKD
jgi:hypothetical protein